MRAGGPISAPGDDMMGLADPKVANDSLAARICEYQCTAEHNEHIHAEFTGLTDTVPWLKERRDLFERNQWGYGDRAFHYMWYLLLIDATRTFSHAHCLEIGVFKGQVISLWAKIAKELGLAVSISAISPLEGNVPTSIWWRGWHGIRRRVDRKYRLRYQQLQMIGNLFWKVDYLRFIREAFSRLQLDLNLVRLIKGSSQDSVVVAQLGRKRFHIIYVDGDHSSEAVHTDIVTYAALIEPGGYLVMDDASFFLPGEGFFKGIESVSRACEGIGDMGFVNVINVGHNRIYKRF